MPADDNTRGFDPDEIEWRISQWYSFGGVKHEEDDPPTGIDFRTVDWLTVEFTYPDGFVTWRSWSGPFDDIEEVVDDYIEAWYDDRQYSMNA